MVSSVAGIMFIPGTGSPGSRSKMGDPGYVPENWMPQPTNRHAICMPEFVDREPVALVELQG